MTQFFQGLAAFGAAALLIVGLMANRIVPSKTTETPAPVAGKKLYRSLIADGVSIQTGKYPGLPLIRFDSCRVEKRAFHGFSLGGFNTLRVEQLELTIPSPLPEPEGTPPSAEGKAASSPVDLLLELELKDLLQTTLPFSAMEVTGLSVYTGNSLPQRVCLLESQSAESRLNRRIALHECRVRTESGTYVNASEAWLYLDRPIRVEAGNRVVNLEAQLPRHIN